MRTANLMEGSKPGDLFFRQPLIDSTQVAPGHGVMSRDEFRFDTRLSIAGKRYSIVCGIQDFEIACRFVDMAVLRFKAFMRSDAVRYNYSEAQAIADTADTDENGGQLANFFLDKFARTLPGDLKPVTNNEPPTATRERQNKTAALKQRIAELERANIAITQALSVLSERILNLEKDTNE